MPNAPMENHISKRSPKTKSKFREYVEALLTALIVAMLLRSFVVEAFKVPSASMVPTILIGDHLFVNKSAFGIRIPLTKTWLKHFEGPNRGDVVVFIYPRDESKDFIKRVLGVGGDHIQIDGRKIVINGDAVRRLPCETHLVGDQIHLSAKDEDGKEYHFDIDTFPDWESFDFFVEFLNDHPHVVQYSKIPTRQRLDIQVPEGHFFAMGDNRDRSSDSREWGPVPMENLKGRALFIWLSLDKQHFGIRWDRFGEWIE